MGFNEQKKVSAEWCWSQLPSAGQDPQTANVIVISIFQWQKPKWRGGHMINAVHMAIETSTSPFHVQRGNE